MPRRRYRLFCPSGRAGSVPRPLRCVLSCLFTLNRTLGWLFPIPPLTLRAFPGILDSRNPNMVTLQAFVKDHNCTLIQLHDGVKRYFLDTVTFVPRTNSQPDSCLRDIRSRNRLRSSRSGISRIRSHPGHPSSLRTAGKHYFRSIGSPLLLRVSRTNGSSSGTLPSLLSLSYRDLLTRVRGPI